MGQLRSSLGCQSCRERKLTCDRTKPICRRCMIFEQKCSYKLDGDIVCDASPASKPKLQRRPVTKKSSSYSESLEKVVVKKDAVFPPDVIDVLESRQCLQKTPQLSIGERAKCHLLSHFVLVPQVGRTQGFMQFLLPLLKEDKEHEPCPEYFRHAFDACALASLNNRTFKQGSLGQEARSHYMSAISGILANLKRQPKGGHCAFVASILLCGFFEDIAVTSRDMSGWGDHIAGAAHVIENGALEPLVQTEAGRAIYSAVRIKMIIESLCNPKRPLSKRGFDWWMYQSIGDKDTLAGERFLLAIAATNRMAQQILNDPGHTHRRDSVGDLSTVIQQCQVNINYSRRWARAMPITNRPYTWKMQDEVPDFEHHIPEAYPGRVDIYSDYITANAWNLMRLSRLILFNLLIRSALLIPRSHQPASVIDHLNTCIQTARQESTEMLADMISSVPFMLYRYESMRVSAYCSSPCGNAGNLKGLGAYYIGQTLTSIVNHPLLLPRQRFWIESQLKHIDNEFGINCESRMNQMPWQQQAGVYR